MKSKARRWKNGFYATSSWHTVPLHENRPRTRDYVQYDVWELDWLARARSALCGMGGSWANLPGYRMVELNQMVV